MTPEASRALRSGDLLPSLELPAAPHGRQQHLQTRSRDGLVLVLLPERFEPWIGYLQALARSAGEIGHWYARIKIVVQAGARDAADLSDRLAGKLTILSDPASAVAMRLGLEAAGAALLIVDRYGQIYEVVEARSPGALPDAPAIEEWMKFLATQCPECGVIDEPGHGEWAS